MAGALVGDTGVHLGAIKASSVETVAVAALLGKSELPLEALASLSGVTEVFSVEIGAEL